MNKEKPTQDYEVPEPLASNDELPSTATVAAKAPSEAVVTQPTNTDEKYRQRHAHVVHRQGEGSETACHANVMRAVAMSTVEC